MNSVHLIGRLATDVDVKEVNGGSKVSTFILAVDRNAEEADFFRIKAWNSQANPRSLYRRHMFGAVSRAMVEEPTRLWGRCPPGCLLPRSLELHGAVRTFRGGDAHEFLARDHTSLYHLLPWKAVSCRAAPAQSPVQTNAKRIDLTCAICVQPTHDELIGVIRKTRQAITRV